jgi:hypothetical protein
MESLARHNGYIRTALVEELIESAERRVMTSTVTQLTPAMLSRWTPRRDQRGDRGGYA